MKSKIKKMKWQDVTLEQLNFHWEMGLKLLPTQPDYLIAGYMNAYAYGDIAGEGIDVRCEYADEVVSSYLKHVKAIDLHDVLIGIGWEEHMFNEYALIMHKHNDVVHIGICNGDTSYLTMRIEDGHKNETDCVSKEYYDTDDYFKKEFRTIEDFYGVTDVIITDKKGIKRKYILVDNQRDRDVIADTILNLDCEHTNNLMHSLGLWKLFTRVKDYGKENLWTLIDDANTADLSVDIHVEILHDYFFFGHVKEDDDITYFIQGLADEREEWEKILNIENVIDTILSNDENFEIYKSIINQK